MKRKACALSAAGVAKSDQPLSYSLKQILQFTLQRQGLITRNASIGPELFPLHGTSHTTPHLSLLARVDNYQKKHLTDYLNQSEGNRLSYVLLRCMRGTLHVVPASQFDTVTAVYNRIDNVAADTRLNQFALTENEVRFWKEQIRKRLLTEGPVTSATLANSFKPKSKSGCDKGDNRTMTKYPVTMVTSKKDERLKQSTVGIVLNHMMWTSQVLFGLTDAAANVSTGGDRWKKNGRSYGYATLVKSHTCHSDMEIDTNDSPRRQLAEAAALRDLAVWYFELYSPASPADFAWWAGRGLRECRALLHGLREEGLLTPVRVVGMSQEMLILASLQQELDCASGTELTGVRFLPYEDALIKAYKETRYRFFAKQTTDTECMADSAVERCIMWKGEAMPSIWVDGQIVGGWRWSNSVASPSLDVFFPPPTTDILVRTCSIGSGVDINEGSVVPASLKTRILPELKLLCEMVGIDVADVSFAFGTVR